MDPRSNRVAIFQRWLNAQLWQVFLAEARSPAEETQDSDAWDWGNLVEFP